MEADAIPPQAHKTKTPTHTNIRRFCFRKSIVTKKMLFYRLLYIN